MRLEQLKYIIEIYHTHSLSQAAKNLSLSQPSLSNALAALEEEWGVRLFHRLTTGVIPTEAGEKIIPPISEALNDLMLRLSAVGPQPAQEQTLNIMAIPAVCSGLLPEVISDFHHDHPTVSINVLETRPEIFLPALADVPHYLGINACDQMVELSYRPQAESMDFILHSLYLDHFICCAPAGSPLADKQPLTRDDLRQCVSINFSSLFGQNAQSLMESLFPYELSDNHSAIGVNSLESLKKLVAAGVGITVIPRSALYHDPYLEAGQIMALPFEEGRLTFHHHLIMPQKHRLSALEEDFVHRLRLGYETMKAALAKP